jgi:hypothetical protein
MEPAETHIAFSRLLVCCYVASVLGQTRPGPFDPTSDKIRLRIVQGGL